MRLSIAAVVPLGSPGRIDQPHGDNDVIIGTFSVFVILVTIPP
jgi:hypothetical protein